MRAFFQSVIDFLKRLLQRKPIAAQRTDAAQLDRRSPQNAPGSATDALKRLVYRATCQLNPTQRLHASRIAGLLKQADPNFSYEQYQFTKLIDLLKAVPEIVSLERVEPKAADDGDAQRRLPPVYYVRSRTDTTALIQSHLASLLKISFSDGFSTQSVESGATATADGWVHWQSLAEAIAQSSAEFDPSRYGFSSFKALLESRRDLVEFKSDSPDYVRAIAPQKSAARPAADRSADRSSSKTTRVQPSSRSPASRLSRSRLSSPQLSKPYPSRPVRSKRTQKIESLVKSAGISMETLHQKVSNLATIALPEPWHFGPEPPPNFAYPILKSYLRYTFVRLQYEDKVLTSANQRHRAFNTGLLDTLLRPIYALLSRSNASADQAADQAADRWTLDFCIAGEDYAGKMLVAEFSQLPMAANYFENADKAFYYLDAGAPTVDWNHVVKDNMARLPLTFLERYAPQGFVPCSTHAMSTSEFYDYKRSFTNALDADPSGYRNIVSRLEAALEKTLRRTQINYTTAVPTYYPKINSVDLMLPMCIVDEHTVDLALVVRREPSGRYIGHTILTLRQAYNNARLICKLDNHWLPRAMTLSQSDQAVLSSPSSIS